MRHRRVKLTVAAPLGVGVVLVLVFNIVFITSKRTGDEVVNQSVLASGETIISASAKSLFNSLYNLDIDHISNVMDRFIQEPSIVSSVVRGGSGAIVSERTGDTPLPESVRSDLAQRALAERAIVHSEIGVHTVVVGRVAAGIAQIGTLEIVFDETAQRAYLGAKQRRMLVIIVVLLASVMIGAIALTAYTIRPLRALTAAADDIRGGNLDTSVPVRGTEEFAALGNALGACPRKTLFVIMLTTSEHIGKQCTANRTIVQCALCTSLVSENTQTHS